MSKTIEVVVTLKFDEEGGSGADMSKTNGVPISLIVESLANLTKWLSQTCVKQAYGDGVPDGDVADYLQGMILLDREKLKLLCNS